MSPSTVREVVIISTFTFLLGAVCASITWWLIVNWYFRQYRSLHRFVKAIIEAAPSAQAQAEIDELCSVCKHREVTAGLQEELELKKDFLDDVRGFKTFHREDFIEVPTHAREVIEFHSTTIAPRSVALIPLNLTKEEALYRYDLFELPPGLKVRALSMTTFKNKEENRTVQTSVQLAFIPNRDSETFDCSERPGFRELWIDVHNPTDSPIEFTGKAHLTILRSPAS